MRPCYVCTSAGQPPNKALFEEVLFCRSNGTPLTCRSCIQPANDTGELGREGGGGEGGGKVGRWEREVMFEEDMFNEIQPHSSFSSRHLQYGKARDTAGAPESRMEAWE